MLVISVSLVIFLIIVLGDLERLGIVIDGNTPKGLFDGSAPSALSHKWAIFRFLHGMLLKRTWGMGNIFSNLVFIIPNINFFSEEYQNPRLLSKTFIGEPNLRNEIADDSERSDT